jgi:hypothetical protein
VLSLVFSLARVVKYVNALLPRCTPRMGHRPPFDLWSNWCRSRIESCAALFVGVQHICIRPVYV